MKTELERRPWVLLALGLVAGLAARTALWVPAAFLVALIAVFRGRSTAAIVGLVAGLALSPAIVPTLAKAEFYEGPARVASVPRLYPDRVVADAELADRRVVLSLPAGSFAALGDRWHVVGVVRPLSERAEKIYGPRGVSGQLRPVRWARQAPGPRGFVLAETVRREFVAYAARTLPPPSAAAVDALCFNVDTLLDDTTEDRLRTTGTIHIVSVSGIHVVFLAAAVMAVLGLFPIPRLAQIGLLAVLLAFYMAATGMHGPMVRASVVALLSAVAYAFRRDPDILSALALAAVAYLLWSPREVFNPGFQLSFVTVAAFALFLQRGDQGAFPLPWLKASVVASLASAPLVAYHFGMVPLIGLVANGLIAAVVPAIVLLGLAGFAVSPVLPSVGVGALLASAPMVGWMYKVLEWCGTPAWASLAVPDFPAAWLVLPYGAALMAWRRRAVPA